MNKNAEKWVEALRSGKYKQTRSALRNEEGHCCLGVACDLYKDEIGGEWVASESSRSYYFKIENTVESGVLPDQVRKWLGLNFKSGYSYGNGSLSSLNDLGHSFDAIADKIEEAPKGLFIR